MVVNDNDISGRPLPGEAPQPTAQSGRLALHGRGVVLFVANDDSPAGHDGPADDHAARCEVAKHRQGLGILRKLLAMLGDVFQPKGHLRRVGGLRGRHPGQ